MIHPRKVFRAVALVAALTSAPLLAGCAVDSPDRPVAPTSSSVVETPADAVAAAIAQAIADGMDPERVVEAALLLTAGDVQAALAQGIVTPEEVDLARTALADGALQLWIDAVGK